MFYRLQRVLVKEEERSTASGELSPSSFCTGNNNTQFNGDIIPMDHPCHRRHSIASSASAESTPTARHLFLSVRFAVLLRTSVKFESY